MYYGFGETLRNAFSLLYTKIKWPGARLVRLPVYARTKKNIKYGSGLTTGYACRLATEEKSRLYIGNNVTFGDNVQIQSSNEIRIGDNCLFASRVYIGDSNHGYYSGDDQTDPMIPPNTRPVNSGKVIIGNNVWIGNGVTIVGNVNIGDGTIVGANSVVLKDLDPFSIYAGIPARKLKQWNPETKKWELAENK